MPASTLCRVLEVESAERSPKETAAGRARQTSTPFCPLNPAAFDSDLFTCWAQCRGGRNDVTKLVRGFPRELAYSQSPRGATVLALASSSNFVAFASSPTTSNSKSYSY